MRSTLLPRDLISRREPPVLLAADCPVGTGGPVSVPSRVRFKAFAVDVKARHGLKRLGKEDRSVPGIDHSELNARTAAAPADYGVMTSEVGSLKRAGAKDRPILARERMAFEIHRRRASVRETLNLEMSERRRVRLAKVCSSDRIATQLS
jgi:hypothetical protein